MNLYELSREGLEIQNALMEAQGELTPDVELRLDSLLAQGAESIEAAAMVVRGLEASAEACRAEVKRLSERAIMLEDQAERLKARMVFALDTVFGGKVKTKLFTVWSMSAGPGMHFELKPGKTLEDLEKDFPQAVRVKRELNISGLRELADEGELPGELLDSWPVEPKRFVRIK